MPTPQNVESEYTKEYQKIHGEIYAHYRSCDFGSSNLSDTWTHTLEQKGKEYSIDEMLSMHALGSRVNSWIDDCNYLIDVSCLLPEDELILKLLAIGESDFGRPRKDVLYRGKAYSSNFIHHVLIASKIIHAIHQQGIDHPKILEIGGGVGGIQYLLKSYFGKNITYFPVDIPETLLIQEWYSRNVFPQTPVSFKGSSAHVDMVNGGFNFINGYILGSQKIAFNVAINIDSMQEMDASTVKFYVNYIEENLESGGLFFCQNHYGQSSKGPTEPTEYVESPLWKVVQAELSPQIECCTESEQLRAIYVKDQAPHSVELRRLALRLLWNSYLTGHLNNSHPAVAEILKVANTEGHVGSGIDQISTLLQKHQVKIAPALVSHLQHQLYFSAEQFFTHTERDQEAYQEEAPLREKLSEHIWKFHFQYLALMEKVVKEGSWSQEHTQIKSQAVKHLLDAFSKENPSEYWVCYMAGLLFAAKEEKLALSFTQNFSSKIQSPFWLVRLASLYNRFSQNALAMNTLAKIPQDASLDFFVAINCLELFFQMGEKEKARTLFQQNQKRAQSLAEQSTLLKAMALLGDWPGLQLGVLEGIPRYGVAKALDALEVYHRYHQGPEVNSSLRLFLEKNIVQFQNTAPEMLLRLGLFLRKLGEAKGEELIEDNLKKISHHYYPLSYAGRMLLSAGIDELGVWALNESARLRPNTFLHYDFIGQVFYGAKKFEQAEKYFAQALKIKPYLRHIRARHLYAGLPRKIQDSEVLGRAENLELIFQRKQDFYTRLGPANK